MYYMEEIVADSSTIILLAKTTLLRMIATEKKIVITSMVKTEVLEKKEQDDAKIIFRLIQEELVTEHKEKMEYQKMSDDFGIGAGESEMLALAYKEKKKVATDDWRAIKACKVLDIKFITAIHCLIYLAKIKKLDVKMAKVKLKNLEKYGRYNSEIIKDARNIIEGEKNG